MKSKNWVELTWSRLAGLNAIACLIFAIICFILGDSAWCGWLMAHVGWTVAWIKETPRA